MPAKIRGLGGVFKRGGTWWLRYSLHGHEVRKSSHSTERKVAERMLKKEWKAVGAGRNVTAAAERVTVGELLDALAIDCQTTGRRANLKAACTPLRAAFGHHRAVEITPAHIETYKAERLAAVTTRKTTTARGTINWELSTLSRAFTLGREQGRVSAVPFIRKFPEGAARQGFTDRGTFDKVLAGLPPVLADVARFAYESAWRHEEILGLTWADVNREGRLVTLQADRSKNAEARELPLVGALLEVIERRHADRAPTPWVFHHGGRRWTDFRKSWAKATKAAGVAGLLFHDLRRSAVRNLDAAGVSQSVAMRISGHKTPSMYRRYRIVSTADMRAALELAQAHGAAAVPAPKVVPMRPKK